MPDEKEGRARALDDLSFLPPTENSWRAGYNERCTIVAQSLDASCITCRVRHLVGKA
jgi:hypothetical protein